MTGNETSLDVSRRLAKVWSAEDDHAGWWLKMSDDEELAYHYCTCDEECFTKPGELGVPIPARTLSELEAEIGRMGYVATMMMWENEPRVTVAFVGMNKEPCFGQANTIIDALGNAVAEAKEST